MRHHATAQGNIPFTQDEEAQADADEKAFAAQQAANAVIAQIEEIETPSGFTRRQREFLLAKSSDAGLKSALADVEDSISSLRARATAA
jgi:hypothetical protein